MFGGCGACSVHSAPRRVLVLHRATRGAVMVFHSQALYRGRNVCGAYVMAMMWVMEMLHKVCAGVRMRCVVAVVGNRAVHMAHGLHMAMRICRRHGRVYMCVRYTAWHVGHGDVSRGVCRHAHGMCGGCVSECRAVHRVHGLHRSMCGAVTVPFVRGV